MKTSEEDKGSEKDNGGQMLFTKAARRIVLQKLEAKINSVTNRSGLGSCLVNWSSLYIDDNLIDVEFARDACLLACSMVSTNS